MNIKLEKQTVPNFSQVSFSTGENRKWATRQLASGRLINVSNWAIPEYGFSRDRKRRPRVFITPQVMRALEDIPQSMIFIQSTRGRGGQLVILAARALIRARRTRNIEDATFIYALPLDEDEYEDARLFRVEYIEQVGGRPTAVIGFATEFQDG